MPKVKVNDIQMYYDIRGEGFPILLIAGILANADVWDPLFFLPKLSERFKLILFDNRGAGRTDVSDKAYSIKLFADDAAGLMEALKIKRAHVIGQSMGGMIAQELALNHPEKVDKLVLLSTFCGGQKSVPVSWEAGQVVMEISTALAEKGQWEEEMARKLMPIVFTQEFMEENPGLADVVVQLILGAPTPLDALTRQVEAIIVDFDACDRLPQIKAPTLIIAGKKDKFIPSENSEIMAKRIPHSKLVYFKKSAHELFEEIERVTDTVLKFLTTT